MKSRARGCGCALALGLAACARPNAAPAHPLDPGYEPRGPLGGTTRVAFALARGAFLDRPFPTELDRDAGGHIELSNFPGRGGGLLAGYADVIERERDGFSVAETVYFRVEGPLGQLPRDPRSTTTTSSPVLLMDVDPASEDRGKLVAIETRAYEKATAYLPPGTLALKPLSGLVLRPGTLYAAVVRRALGSESGELLGTTDDLEALKATTPRADPLRERARLLFAPALDVLAARGVARADIAAVAVFRTGTPHRATQRLVAALDDLPPAQAPSLLEARLERSPDAKSGSSFVVIRGTLCLPSFQERLDDAPFLERGGEVALDPGGTPRVAPLPPAHGDDACGPRLRARFTLSLPAGATEREIPLVVSAHGTGGDADTFLGERDFAGWAAKIGAAVVSTDQPLHGARPGRGKPVSLPIGPLRIPIRGLQAEGLFYNPLRPAAAIGNMLQATADAGALIRVFAGLDLDAALARDPGRARTHPGPLPRLSPTRVMLAGHSQGSQSLFALGAFEPRVRAVLLSGAGGDLRQGVLQNKEFAAVREILEPLLGLEAGELDAFHPVLALVQLLADPADPQTYARFYRELPRGRRPTSVLHLEGLRDGYNPEAASEALAAALVATPLAPLLKSFPALDVLGLRAADVVRGNAAGGRATIAFVQLAPTHGEDGHFVMYEEPAGAALVTAFFAAALKRNDLPPTIARVER